MACLRRWDLPYAENRCSLTSRSSRCSPRERGKLIQRSRLAQVSHASPRYDPPDKLYLEKTLDMAHDREGRDTPPIQNPPRNVSMVSESKDRFCGALSGPQVEEELRRLSTLLKGLSREFVLVKDSVWHLEDERNRMQERMDHFEQTEFKTLNIASKETDGRLHTFIGQVEVLDARVATIENTKSRSKHTGAQLEELVRRVDLLDARLTVHEDTEKHIRAAQTLAQHLGAPGNCGHGFGMTENGPHQETLKAAACLPDISELLKDLDERPLTEETRCCTDREDCNGELSREVDAILPEKTTSRPGTCPEINTTSRERPRSAFATPTSEKATEGLPPLIWGAHTYPQDDCFQRRVRPGRTIEFHSGFRCFSQNSSTGSKGSSPGPRHGTSDVDAE